jgi:hypothetical protein
MKAAYDVEINYFNCAENYSGDESEKVMSLAIKISTTCELKKQCELQPFYQSRKSLLLGNLRMELERDRRRLALRRHARPHRTSEGTVLVQHALPRLRRIRLHQPNQRERPRAHHLLPAQNRHPDGEIQRRHPAPQSPLANRQRPLHQSPKGTLRRRDLEKGPRNRQ